MSFFFTAIDMIEMEINPVRSNERTNGDSDERLPRSRRHV